MAFVLELGITSKQVHLYNFIVAKIRAFGIKAKLKQDNEKLVVAFESEHEKLQECLDSIANTLPASIFLRSSKSYTNEVEPDGLPELKMEYPLALGLCPECQKEMMDVSSRRYYYPFTSCLCCGGNHAFLNRYPYTRENSSFRFLVPCDACQKEMEEAGRKERHHINSCHHCAPPVRLTHKAKERYANDAGSFRTMFEVAAKAIADKKSLLVKTTMGYRLFHTVEESGFDSILMMIDANRITDHLSLITEEYQALLSIERPILYVALKNETLKETLKANTAFVKYPDDGFSILLGVELQKLGYDFIAYEEADANTQADMVMEYDLAITPQTDIHYFINKDTRFVAAGERVSFPTFIKHKSESMVVAGTQAALPYKEGLLVDKVEYFEEMGVKVAGVRALAGDTHHYHSHQESFYEDEAAFAAVIAQNDAFGTKCVGAYFEEELSFLYYNGTKTIRVVPAKEFDTSDLIERLKSLREGSDRLMENLKTREPHIYKELEKLQNKKGVSLFEAAAIIMELEERSYLGVSKEAMKFIGKGGIQIDTHIKDNRFDYAAFLASIISYRLAGVESTIVAYSIFESLGDYITEILQELYAKVKAKHFAICGSYFANQSLYSRIERNFKLTPPLIGKSYPLGKESAVVGAVYL